MDWTPKYKTKGEVKPRDKGDYIFTVGGNVVDSIDLKYSKEVALSKRQKELIFSSADPFQNRPSARINRKTGRTLDRGIQLYRMWFNYLKLALELEELNVSLVRRGHTFIQYHNNPNEPIPPEVIRRSEEERRISVGYKVSQSVGTKKGSGVKYIVDNPLEIFRCKRIEKVKVKRSKYKGWDLDEVLTQSFDEWWQTHSNLFEGYFPSVMKSKDDWIDDPNFVYVRIDKTSQWTDVKDFMSYNLSKLVKNEGRPRYKLSGKNPRSAVLQNNYNALVLSLKGWSPKEICLNKDIFLRKTDAHMDAKRTVGDRLTVPKYKGKPQYPNLVGTQRKSAVHHIFEVCNGAFGTAPPRNP